MALKTQNKSKERYLNMKCQKCKTGNMVELYDENPKCVQCGFQEVDIPKEVLKEVEKSLGQNIIHSKPHEPKYYYDLEYRDKLLNKK
tara:strand:- start:1419 stop:1679 length:261 start_codon:yes stop_codon:yes gene_type:complete